MHDTATIARFVAAGLGAALLLFVLTWSLAAAGLPPFAAGTIAYAVAFAAAYLVQRGWSFGGHHAHGHALPRYLIAQAKAAFTSGVTAHFATTTLIWGHEASALLATTAASAVSFLLSLFWVFPPRTGVAGR
jgi:putative flippase GtrA